MEKIVVVQKYAGMRIDQLLSHLHKDISRSQIQRYIENGSITCNGHTIAKNYRVAVPDEIVTSIPLDFFQRRPTPTAQNIPLEVLFEDEFLLAVNKPAGCVVHPGNGNPDGTLVNALLHYTHNLSDGSSSERPGIVHRLDKETSGVVLVAKNNVVHRRLSAAFADRRIRKTYIGVCMGNPAETEGVISKPLDRSRRDPVKRAVSSRGKDAVTLYGVAARRCGIAVVRFFPKTGRTHQIRVHSSHAGFPIIGDILYGGGKERILRIDPAERPFAYQVFKCFTRHALHAQSISFTHPGSNQDMCISAPFPDDFRNALRQFGDLQLIACLRKNQEKNIF